MVDINELGSKIKGCTLIVPFDFQRNEFWTEEQMQDLIGDNNGRH